MEVEEGFRDRKILLARSYDISNKGLNNTRFNIEEGAKIGWGGLILGQKNNSFKGGNM
jgi:hypothetical protein